jgi:hypothetical protein
VFRVERFKDVPHFASKLAIESAIREFDVPFTIIRPNYFFQNDASFKDIFTKMSVYPNPLGLAGISAVDIRDIAEATAISLTSDKHFGRTYNVNGPAILSGPKVASIWSQVLGKKIDYAGDNLDSFEEQMRKHGPSWAAFDIRMMFQGYLERGFVAGDGDIATLTKLLSQPIRARQLSGGRLGALSAYERAVARQVGSARPMVCSAHYRALRQQSAIPSRRCPYRSVWTFPLFGCEGISWCRRRRALAIMPRAAEL